MPAIVAIEEREDRCGIDRAYSLSPMPACDRGAYLDPGVLGSVRSAALDRAYELQGGFVQEPLPLVLALVPANIAAL